MPEDVGEEGFFAAVVGLLVLGMGVWGRGRGCVLRFLSRLLFLGWDTF